MRDPIRIKRILAKLEILWAAMPDQRLGQLYIMRAAFKYTLLRMMY